MVPEIKNTKKGSIQKTNEEILSIAFASPKCEIERKWTANLLIKLMHMYEIIKAIYVESPKRILIRDCFVIIHLIKFMQCYQFSQCVVISKPSIILYLIIQHPRNACQCGKRVKNEHPFRYIDTERDVAEF